MLYLLAQIVKLLEDDMMSSELFGGLLTGGLRMDEQSYRRHLRASLSLLRCPLAQEHPQ